MDSDGERAPTPEEGQMSHLFIVEIEAEQVEILHQLCALIQRVDLSALSVTRVSAQAVPSFERPEARLKLAHTLSHRQMQILPNLLQSRSNKEIARIFGLSHFTVRNHVSAIFKAFGVKDRRALQGKFLDLRHVAHAEPTESGNKG